MKANPHLTDELLSAHIDDALTSQESAAVSAHLFTCSDCSARRELLRATSHPVATLTGGPASQSAVRYFPAAGNLSFSRHAQPRGAASGQPVSVSATIRAGGSRETISPGGISVYVSNGGGETLLASTGGTAQSV